MREIIWDSFVTSKVVVELDYFIVFHFIFNTLQVYLKFEFHTQMVTNSLETRNDGTIFIQTSLVTESHGYPTVLLCNFVD